MQQLDLFADSAAVQRANALIDALSRFDRVASQQALQSLMSADPAHSGLAHFHVLHEFVNSWPDGCDDPRWPRTPAGVAAAAQLIVQRIMPAAAVMGSAGHSLIRKSWSDLARASEVAGIGPEHPDCFAAELDTLPRRNLPIYPSPGGRAASLQKACVVRPHAPFAPCIASRQTRLNR